MGKITTYERLREKVLRNPDSRWAYKENELRAPLGRALDKRRTKKMFWLTELAERTGLTKARVRRVLHKEQGGDVLLSDIVKLADVLGLRIVISVEEEKQEEKHERGTRPRRRVRRETA